MTKIRPPETTERAVMRALVMLGDDGAAKTIGKSASLIRCWSDPDDDRKITMDAAVALDIACASETGEMPFLEAHRRQVEKGLRDRGIAIDEDPYIAVMGMTRELGRITELVMSGGGANPQHLKQALANLRSWADKVEDSTPGTPPVVPIRSKA